MKKRFFLSAMAIVWMTGIPGRVGAQEITGNHRLMESFIQDGSILRQGWLEAAASYSHWGDGHDSELGARVAFSFKERIEVGGQFFYLDRTRPENAVVFGERLSADINENGPGDLDVYGKFRFRTEPRDWSAGLLVKLPGGDDRERLGSGRTDYEAFLATRQTYKKFAWIGNVSLRLNGDSRTPGGANGKLSSALGAGAILKLSYAWSFLAEMRYETRRYDGGDVDFRIVPAIDFRPNENLALRLGAAFGLADGAPDEEGTFAVVFHY